MIKPVVVGAVLYDPKVSIIWNIIREFFEASGVAMDVVFFTNYEQQVRSLAGRTIDMAWNSPLAWLDSCRVLGMSCRAIAMRDTDRDRVTHFVVKKDAPMRSLADLRDKILALGARDSPQARLIPHAWLKRHGLEPDRDLTVSRFDVLVGKHGDHIGGELDAFRALTRGEADASAMIDLNWDTWTKDGTIDPNRYRILSTTDRFDHCVFTVREDFARGVEERWLEVLYSMSYDNPQHREMMDMEGLKAWVPGRTTGFGLLTEAIEETRFFGDHS
jgi:phosphonate transport system substrate-binding protein